MIDHRDNQPQPGIEEEVKKREREYALEDVLKEMREYKKRVLNQPKFKELAGTENLSDVELFRKGGDHLLYLRKGYESLKTGGWERSFFNNFSRLLKGADKVVIESVDPSMLDKTPLEWYEERGEKPSSECYNYM